MSLIFDESQFNHRFIKEKTVKGVVFALSTTVFRAIINFVGNVVLARLLTPSVFGAFGILSFSVQQVPVLLYDFGLQDALVQKRKPLGKKEVATVFTVNAATAALFVAIIFFAAPFLSRHYGIDSQGPWLFRIFSLIIFTFLLEGIPLALLKRRIGFDQLIWVSLAGAVSFNLITIALAIFNFELLSLVYGTLLSRIFSLLTLFKFQSWQIAFAFEREKLKKLLNFGLPLKGTTILGLIALSIVPLLVGSVAGLEAVGYFGFSDRILGLVMIVPSTLSTILFSSLSRSQDRHKLFKVVVEKSIEWVGFLVFPIAAIFIALAPQIISLIFTDKWLPALWVFYFGVLAVVVSSLGGIFSQALLSLGKAREMLKISSLQAVLAWGLSLPLVFLVGYNGVALAKLVASLSSFLSLFFLRKQIRPQIVNRVFPSFFAALASGGAIKLLVPHVLRGIVTLFLLAGCGLIIYLLLLLPFKGRALWEDGKKIERSLLEAK